MVRLRNENKFQDEIPVDVPFPCNVTGKKLNIQSVKLNTYISRLRVHFFNHSVLNYYSQNIAQFKLIKFTWKKAEEYFLHPIFFNPTL